MFNFKISKKKLEKSPLGTNINSEQAPTINNKHTREREREVTYENWLNKRRSDYLLERTHWLYGDSFPKALRIHVVLRLWRGMNTSWIFHISKYLIMPHIYSYRLAFSFNVICSFHVSCNSSWRRCRVHFNIFRGCFNKIALLMPFSSDPCSTC